MWQMIGKKLQLVDLLGIGNLLEHLIAGDGIACEERDRIIQRLAAGNDVPAHTLPVLAGYRRSKADVLERATCRKPSEPLCTKRDESYISLTEFVRAHSEYAPGYVIQSWLRSGKYIGTSEFVGKGKQPRLL